MELIDRALRDTQERPRYAYVAPLRKQAKEVAWDYLKAYTLDIPGAVANEAELRIDLPNQARIQLFGADNYNAMRGQYFDGVILDEYADIDPRTWSEVLRPALSDRLGWAIFIGTPRGKNAFWELYEHAANDDEWWRYKLKASESGLIPKTELDAARRSMSEDQYEQEFECSFEAAIVGAYYGKEMKAAEAEKRITGVAHDPASKVYTAWDLGIDDATSIWFVQRVGREIHVIDFYESHDQPLSHYVNVLTEGHRKQYVYADHYFPHDTAARELGTGKSREEVLRSLGVTPTISGQMRVEDGIEAVRRLLPQCWFDTTKCARGVEALKQYRREYDDKNKTYRQRPYHDWTSHPADAFRELAMSFKPKDRKPLDFKPMAVA